MESPGIDKDLISEISLWYGRMTDSRHLGETVVEKMFERRMNEALDRYSDYVKFVGQTITVEAGNEAA